MAIGVAMGAFGAHGLKSAIEYWYPDEFDKRMANWETAARYHVYHAMGLILLGCLWPTTRGQKSALVAAISFGVGIALFSGGLYVWVIANERLAVSIVPIGGLAFITGWISMCWMLIVASADQQYEGSE